MKKLQYLTPILLVSIILISACGGGEDKETTEEVFMKQITGAWQLRNADFDGKDVSSSFPGMTLTINKNKTMSVQNATPPMWKASSSFTLLGSGNDFILNRNDGLIITVSQVSETKLVLTFLYDADAMGGRTSSVTGGFTFEFDVK